MGEACKRDPKLWCPLSEDDCTKDRSKPCVFLTPTYASILTMSKMGYEYNKYGILAKVDTGREPQSTGFLPK